MGDCPVDKDNLSFSDDESIFITQRSFWDVTTQEVKEAVDYLDNLGDVGFAKLKIGRRRRTGVIIRVSIIGIFLISLIMVMQFYLKNHMF